MKRERTALAISGIDTSTMDYNAADGKCEELKNLRLYDGAWRNVHEFDRVVDLPDEIPESMKILYHHPATENDVFIVSMVDEHASATMYAYSKPASLNAVQTVYLKDRIAKVGDAVFCKVHDMGLTYYAEYSKISEIVSSDESGNVLSFLTEYETSGENLKYYAWKLGNGLIRYTTSENIKSGDKIYVRNGYEFIATSFVRSKMDEESGEMVYFDSYFYRIDTDDDLMTAPVDNFIAKMERDAASDYQVLKPIPFSYDSSKDEALAIQYALYSVRFVDGEIVVNHRLRDMLYDSEGKSMLRISHFGKVLLIFNDATKSIEYYFLQSDGVSYKQFNTANLEVRASIVEEETVSGQTKIDYSRTTGSELSNKLNFYGDILLSTDGLTTIKTHNDDGFWRGELAYFVALRMTDGSVVYRTPVSILNSQRAAKDQALDENEELVKMFSSPTGESERYEQGEWWHLVAGYVASATTCEKLGDDAGAINSLDIDYNKPFHITPNTVMWVPTIEISLPDNMGDDYSQIKSVAIYATRLHSLWDFDKLKEDNSRVKDQNIDTIYVDGMWSPYITYLVKKEDIAYYQAKNDLPKQPFYLLEDIDIKDFEEGKYTFKLNYSKLENIQSNELFVPTIVDELYAEGVVEYNNRLHLFNVTQKMPSIEPASLNVEYDDSSQADKRRYVVIEGEYDTEPYLIRTDAEDLGRYVNADVNTFSKTQPFLLQYPSYTGKRMMFVGRGGAVDGSVLAEFELESADAMNMSFFLNYAETGNLRYTDIVLPDEPGLLYNKRISAAATATIQQTNRLQASAANNCVIYPYENSYRIGSSEAGIVAANSVAVEMSDAKFGEYPLYVFTTEGIYAMHMSSDNSVLYASATPVSYDVAINSNTLAVNYNVIYVTSSGIRALSARGITPLSLELNKNGQPPAWLKMANFIFLRQFDEILAICKDERVGYIYSSGSRLWSKRDMPAGYVINEDMLVGEKNVFNMRIERTEPSFVQFSIVTRPIKLKSGKELKRIETLVMRLQTTAPMSLSVMIEGSVDCETWYRIRECAETSVSGDVLIRRTRMSAKYIRLSIEGETDADLAMTAIEIEYYIRMIHRLR